MAAESSAEMDLPAPDICGSIPELKLTKTPKTVKGRTYKGKEKKERKKITERRSEGKNTKLLC